MVDFDLWAKGRGISGWSFSRYGTSFPTSQRRKVRRGEKGSGVFSHRLGAYDCEKIINGDKANRDIFWLRGERLDDSDSVPEPGVLAQEIVEDLDAALEQFREMANDLGGRQEWFREKEMGTIAHVSSEVHDELSDGENLLASGYATMVRMKPR